MYIALHGQGLLYCAVHQAVYVAGTTAFVLNTALVVYNNKSLH